MPVFQHGLTGARVTVTDPEDIAWYRATPPWYETHPPEAPNALPPSKRGKAKPKT